jgi:hypothetical protein
VQRAAQIRRTGADENYIHFQSFTFQSDQSCREK